MLWRFVALIYDHMMLAFFDSLSCVGTRFFFVFVFFFVFFFQAEDGIRVLVRSRGLVDVYKR